MAKKRYYNDDRRKKEYEDSMMISEDRNAIANLPKEVKYVQYPQSPYWKEPGLNDTLRGVDRQMADDVYSKSLKKSAYPEKY